jgi:pyruvate dehydrogenase E1 component beta subunit
MKKMTYLDAIKEAIREEMRRDEKVFLMGEDIGIMGGYAGQRKGLLEEFGEERVRDTPISETVIVGGGVGAAMTGMRPIVELMFADFVYIAGSEIHHNAGNWRHTHGGQWKDMPLVIRTTSGGMEGGGATHSECPEAFCMHSPGIKVVSPSMPSDAKGLMKTAIRDNNPVVFFEHKALFPFEGLVSEDEDFIIPFGRADIKRKGKDVTVVAISRMVHRALAAAEELAKDGIDVEVVDPRTLVPLDKETILESLKKTNRIVIVEEGYRTCGVGSEIAAIVSDEGFAYLDAPIKRVAEPDIPMPTCPIMEAFLIPSVNTIITEIRKVL